MANSRVRFCASAPLACAFYAWAGLAQAQSPSELARTQFERGYALTQQGAFEAAIEQFKLAYATSPNFSVLFNLGQAYGAAGHPVEAARTLTQYLEIGGSSVDDEQRRATQPLIAYYRQRIGGISVGPLPAHATLVLDGEELGSAPLAGPVEASAGRHGLAVLAPGYQPWLRTVQVKAGQVAHFDVLLIAEHKPLSYAAECSNQDRRAQELEGTRRQRAQTQKTVALALGGSAVLTAGAAAALAIFNDARYDSWRQRSAAFTSAFQRDPSTTSPRELDQLLRDESSIRNRDALALGLGIAAGSLAASSVALYLTAGSTHGPNVSVSARALTFGYSGELF